MTDEERRARHAAYMRAYRSDPERRRRHNANSNASYHANREETLERRREKSGAGPRRRRWTKPQILKAIRELAVDGIATCPDSGSLPGVASYRFGSWSLACHEAGVISAWEAPLSPDARYSTVHTRLYKERGAPQQCEQCGASGPGRRYEWSFKWSSAPDHLVNDLGNPYSTRIHDDYWRLCKRCHGAYDRQRNPQ